MAKKNNGGQQNFRAFSKINKLEWKLDTSLLTFIDILQILISKAQLETIKKRGRHNSPIQKYNTFVKEII